MARPRPPTAATRSITYSLASIADVDAETARAALVGGLAAVPDPADRGRIEVAAAVLAIRLPTRVAA